MGTRWPERKCIVSNSEFANVKAIQKCLHKLYPGYTEGEFDKFYTGRAGRANPNKDLTKRDDDYVDGICGPVTVKTIKEFQRKHKDKSGRQLKDDGVVGPLTSWALKKECDACDEKDVDPKPEPELPEEPCADFNEQCYLLWNLFRPEIMPYYIAQTLQDDAKSSKKTVRNPLTIVDGDPSDFLNEWRKSRYAKAMMDLTPAQKALLVPEIKLSKIYVDSSGGIEEEKQFAFQDFVSKTSLDKIFHSARSRGGGIGIKNVKVSMHGQYTVTAKSIFDVEITYFLQSAADLFAEPDDPRYAPYVDLITVGPGQSFNLSKKPQVLNSPGSRQCKDQNYESDLADEVRSARLKLEFGWAAPVKNLKLIPPDLKMALKEDKLIMYLNSATHDMQFNQDGTIDITANYKARAETVLKSAKADIFGSHFSTIREKEEDREKTVLDDNLPPDARRQKIELERQRDEQIEKIQGDKTIKSDSKRKEKIDSVKKEADAKIRSMQFDVIYKQKTKEALESIMKDIMNKNRVMFLSLKNEDIMDYLRAACAATVREKRRIQEAQNKLKGKKPGKTKPMLPPSKTTAQPSSKRSQVLKDVLKAKGFDKFNSSKWAKIEKAVKAPDLKEVCKLHIPYVFVGDIFDAILQNIQEDVGATALRYRVLLGPIRLLNRQSPEDPEYIANIADIPVSLSEFTQWFGGFLLGRARGRIPFKRFVDRFMQDFLLKILGINCTAHHGGGALVGDKVRFEMSEVLVMGSGKGHKQDPLHNRARIDLQEFAEKVRRPRSGAKASETYSYFVITAWYDNKGDLKGNKKKDYEKGIYHLPLGRDRGLIKNMSFSSVDNEHLHAYRVMSTYKRTQQFRLPYNCNISMIGNPYFFPGQTVFINPSLPGMGSAVNPDSPASRLGLGGYYLLVSVDHDMSPSGYNVTANAEFQSVPRNCPGAPTARANDMSADLLLRRDLAQKSGKKVDSGESKGWNSQTWGEYVTSPKSGKQTGKPTPNRSTGESPLLQQ